MNKRTPKFALSLIFAFSAMVFVYFNFCPSVGHKLGNDQSYLMNVSQEILKLPEMEVIAKACKMVISFLFP